MSRTYESLPYAGSQRGMIKILGQSVEAWMVCGHIECLQESRHIPGNYFNETLHALLMAGV